MANHNPAPEATDWDTYYTHVPATAKLTRRYTTRVLIEAIQRYGRARKRGPAFDRRTGRGK